MRSILLLAALAAVIGLPACSSHPEPYEDDWEMKYMHSYDFMWDQCIAALQQQYRIEKADEESHTITTDWDEHLAVMAYQGYRTRLIVTIEGDVDEGYKVKAREEREQNAEQINPDSSAEADWEPGTADGGTLARFRIALHRRLNPKESWREAEAR